MHRRATAHHYSAPLQCTNRKVGGQTERWPGNSFPGVLLGAEIRTPVAGLKVFQHSFRRNLCLAHC